MSLDRSLLARVVRAASILISLPVTLSGCFLFSNHSEDEVEITFQPQRDLPRLEAQIAPDEENVIGRAVAAKLFSLYRNIDNTALTLYVNRVGKTVAGFSPRPDTFVGYSFVVVESPEVNALAAPGGYIFLSRGLLERMSDEDMLAAVLAHEVAHVVSRHGLKAIAREHMADYTPLGSLSASAVDCTGLSQQLVTALDGAVKDIVDRLLVSGFSREQELEADRIAVEILGKAGYDPTALDRVFAILENQTTSSGVWFSTHPKFSDRRAALMLIPQSISNKFRSGYLLRKQRFLASTSKI